MAVTIEDTLLFCSRFDRMTHALTKRGQKKPPIPMTDEYDVQEFAYAALKPLVDDLTLEDPTAKVAGAAGRVDLVSYKLGLAIEVKATLKANREDAIVRECFERIKLYSSVRDIRVLAFFVYDPEKKLDDHDNVQRGLEAGSHTAADGGTFRVHVVGPGFEKTFQGYDSAATGPIEVKVGEVKYLTDVGAVVVNVTARGAGRTPVAPRLTLRVGNTRYELGVPPSAYQVGGSASIYSPTDADLVERGDATLYFGPTESAGQPVALRSTGVLEVEVPGMTRPMQVPFEIPVPCRDKVKDEDALNELSSWFYQLKDKDRASAIKFDALDQQLRLPTGTSKRLLERAVSEHYEVVRKGDDTIMFKFRERNYEHRDRWDRIA